MSAPLYSFEGDLRLAMTLPARPEEWQIRRVAADLGCSRAQVRRRRRAIRHTLRRLAGRGGRR